MEDKEPIVELTVTDHGPLIVKGPVKLITPDGNIRIVEKCAICRCEGSNRQPFCDGTHTRKKYEQVHETFS